MICRPEDEDDTAAAGAVGFKGKEVFIMPGFDRTGPRGEGPMTGGARGFCNPGYGPGFGRGYGMGWGRGFRGGVGPGFGRGRAYGWRGAYGPFNAEPYAMSREEELRMLKEEADMVKADLDSIKKRMEELESE